MKRLLVTGASGLLGLNLGFQAAGRYQVLGITNSRALKGAPFESEVVDLSRPGAARQVFERFQPDLVVHCAALANIDEAERSPENAWRVNAEVPGEIAFAAKETGAWMVHVSTDAVFDGERGGYDEQDAANPLSVYARSKLGGELAVERQNPSAAVARVNFFGWSLEGRRSLAEFFFNHLSVGKRVNGFTDVLFCPLLVTHLAEILLEMVEKKLSGRYHAVSRESLSKYQFGVMIAREFGLDADLIAPVSVLDGGLAARRSPNLTLQVSKLERALGHPLPGIAEGISEFHRQFTVGYPQRLMACLLAG